MPNPVRGSGLPTIQRDAGSKYAPRDQSVYPAAILGLICLAVFVADLIAVETGATQTDDRNLELWVHHLLGSTTYGFFELMSTLGDTVDRIIEIIAVVLFLVLWRRWIAASFTAVAVLLGTALDTLLKDIVRRPRPHLFHWPTSATGFSFPSGHSTSAMVFSAVVAYLVWRLFRHGPASMAMILFMAVFAFLVGLSRIVLGVHYPTDVVGGFALGGVAVCASILAFEWFAPTAAWTPSIEPEVGTAPAES